MEMEFFSQDGIFSRHLNYRPQRITKEEHMICALEARELNKTSLLLKEFYDGAQLFVEKVHIEGIQDVWAFDRLGFPQPDHAKVTTRSDYIYEMICIWESFFPNYENFFQLHQIMDQIIITTRSDTMKRYSRHFEEIVKRW
jgi:hypothetical protein